MRIAAGRGELALNTTLATPPDEVIIPLRLDDDLMLKLAHAAHEADMTLNAVINAALALALADRRRRAPGSRNQREGRYLGNDEGKTVRGRCAPGYRPLSAATARHEQRRRTYAAYGIVTRETL